MERSVSSCSVSICFLDMDGEALMFYSQTSSPCPLSGVLQDCLGSHRPLLAHHRDDSGWNSPREQVRPGESESALSLLLNALFVTSLFFVFFFKWKHIFSGDFYQCEELAERAGAPDLLQDLCSRPVSHHPLPQQVSSSPARARDISARWQRLARCVFHRENKPRKGGICVANHTSPIDVVILANDGCYAMVSLTHRWAGDSCF